MTPAERAAAIESRKEKVEGRGDRRWARGAFRVFDIFRVPVEYLVLNADNRRFRAERLRWEEELGRELDPIASEADERSIMSILLDDDCRIADDEVVGKESKESKALVSDWNVRGQEQPLWIRPDGYVINGNRRLAALKRLAVEHGTATGSYKYVEVIILALDDIDDDELFEMEAREQLTEGLKVRYGDLNLLLTLKEAAERQGVAWTDDASIEEVAAQIQDLVGNNPSYAAVQLRAIRYMDEYLEYTGEPGRYQRMIGQVERFRDIGKNMQVAQRESPESMLELLELQFQAVQAGAGHLDIRELRKLMIEEPDRFSELAREVQQTVEASTPADVAAPTEEEQEADPAFELDDPPEDPPAPPGPSFPRTPVKRSIELAIEARRSRRKNDAEAALRAAADRLSQVTPAKLAELLNDARPPVVAALASIRTWVESVRDVGE